jgi:hypothetical protein
MNEIDKTVTINLIVYLQSEKYSNIGFNTRNNNIKNENETFG